MKKKIDIAGIDPILFVGLNDENIKLLEKSFKSKIVVRGNIMNVDGDKSEINHIELVVRNMLTLINKQGSLSSEDVSDLLSFKELRDDKVLSIENPIVLHSHKGPIFAKTKGQKLYLEAVLKNDIVFAVGPAGTGKTYQAVASAVASLKNKEVEKIVITRPAVEAGERLGFLPGDLKEKVDPYLRPIYDALYEMMPSDRVEKKIQSGEIEIAPLAFMRGRTFTNSYVIVDEAQNTTSVQMKMVLTRIGEGSRMVINGDLSQVDLPKGQISGLKECQEILNKIEDIKIIYLEASDVIRHPIVAKIVEAYRINSNDNG